MSKPASIALAKHYLITRIVCFVVCALVCTGVHAQYRWPTLEFEVFPGNPWVGSTLYGIQESFDWLETEDWIDRMSDEQIHEFERAFNEAAVWYQKHGFPPPALEINQEAEGGPKYRVYVCSYERDREIWDSLVELANSVGSSVLGSSLNLENFELGVLEPEFSRCGGPQGYTGAYMSDCNAGRSQIFYINRDAALGPDGKLTELGYQTLAHEMFHAIWPKTAAGQSEDRCYTGKWVTEGISDALGWDIAEELWRHRYTPSTSGGDIGKRWGTRPYNERLPQKTAINLASIGGAPFPIGYRTSSFWRFLADVHPKGWNIFVSAGRPGPPGLLDISMEGSRGWRREVNWIDKGLRGKFNYGLDAMYSSFVGWFVYSIPPYSSFENRPPESLEVVDEWAKLLFEECETIDLRIEPMRKVSLELKGLASKCIWVEQTGTPGAQSLMFQVAHDDLDVLRDIWISKPGTTLQVRGSHTGELPGGPARFITTWAEFTQDGGKPNLYVISNVARKPDQSKPREFELTASIPSNKVSTRGELPARKHVPAPEKPAHEKHARTRNRREADTRKMVNEQINEDKKSLTEHAVGGTRVSRSLNEPNCDEPFRYDPCGPQMHISLTVAPGNYLSLGQASAQGGAAGQVMGSLQAMAQTSAFDTMEVVPEMQAKISAIDGSSVSISTPLFDYGFSGSFSNALISVTMRNDERLSSRGAMDSNCRAPLTGQVTIEEYTPFIVRGSFSARVVDFGQPPENSCQAPITRSESVSGTFASVAPWREDERVVVMNDSEEVMREEIMNALGVPAGMANRLTEDGNPGSQDPGGTGSSSGSSSGGGFLDPDCSCECENREAADELCEFFCEVEFAACEN
ncbi:MAG TPA: hypothetical protein VJ984_11625 [Xanthomonadales bacterium]|nr:hypothetical protein [Xanthomonadales bacterium]